MGPVEHLMEEEGEQNQKLPVGINPSVVTFDRHLSFGENTQTKFASTLVVAFKIGACWQRV